MKTIVFKGTKSHPQSYRLAPHVRLFKGKPVEVEDDVAAVLLKCEGVSASKPPKSDA